MSGYKWKNISHGFQKYQGSHLQKCKLCMKKFDGGNMRKYYFTNHFKILK